MGSWDTDIPKTSMTLEQYWTNVANSNKEGDSTIIDKKEQEFLYGSIYFVEEGMTKEEFIAKNLAIYETQPKMRNGMLIADVRNKNKESLQTAVSRVVNQMLDKGEFDAKKDVIMGKIKYLDDATQTRVLKLLNPEEQNEVKKMLRPQIHVIDQCDMSKVKDGDYGVKGEKTYKYNLIKGEWEELSTEDSEEAKSLQQLYEEEIQLEKQKAAENARIELEKQHAADDEKKKRNMFQR